MIINFSDELKKIINHSADLCKSYDIRIEARNHIPTKHREATLIFDEDLEKICAICAAADELDKRNKELENKIKKSGLEDIDSFYYPLGGGSLF
jgi:hypothetical protein